MYRPNKQKRNNDIQLYHFHSRINFIKKYVFAINKFQFDIKKKSHLKRILKLEFVTTKC